MTSQLNHKESKEIPYGQRKTTPATPIHAHHLMAASLAYRPDTSAYESSEDEAINLVECDQVNVEVKKDKVGVKYVKV